MITDGLNASADSDWTPEERDPEFQAHLVIISIRRIISDPDIINDEFPEADYEPGDPLEIDMDVQNN